jgi:hypothetical protein
MPLFKWLSKNYLSINTLDLSEVFLAKAVLEAAQQINEEYASPVCRKGYVEQLLTIIDRMQSIVANPSH